MPNSLSFKILFIDLKNLFYCNEDEDDNSGDIFEKKMIEERLYEEIEDDINPHIYDRLDVISR